MSTLSRLQSVGDQIARLERERRRLEIRALREGVSQRAVARAGGRSHSQVSRDYRWASARTKATHRVVWR